MKFVNATDRRSSLVEIQKKVRLRKPSLRDRFKEAAIKARLQAGGESSAITLPDGVSRWVYLNRLLQGYSVDSLGVIRTTRRFKRAKRYN